MLLARNEWMERMAELTAEFGLKSATEYREALTRRGKPPEE